MEKRIRIQNLEDEEVDHMALLRAVKEKGLTYDVDRAGSLSEASDLLKGSIYDIALLDYMMPDGTGLDLLEKIREIPSIFITGSGNEMVAVKAMKGGVYDYLIKDTAGMYLELLPSVIEKTLGTARLRKEKEEAERKLSEKLDTEERLNKILLQREFRMKELKGENDLLKKRVEELEGRNKI